MDWDALLEKVGRLERENEALRAEVERLRRAWEEAQRSGKRQAAPFSRPAQKAQAQAPGRKAGYGYGRHGRRAAPERIDERIEAELPACCPECGGSVAELEVVSQYQAEIPEARARQIEFRVHVGRCRGCGRRVQGRHARQSSDAVGAAGSQLGPRAVALAAELNKGLGLPYAKTAQVLQSLGVGASRGGICRAVARLGSKAQPTYDALVRRVHDSPQVTPDETGWRVGGRSWWMWVAATPEATVHGIEPGRGFEQATALLSADYAGFLVRDGWGVYRKYERAVHQTCLAHLLRRCRELRDREPRAVFAPAVQRLLQDGLMLRDRYQAGGNSRAAFDDARQGLERRLDKLLARRRGSAAERRFARHLERERDAVFTFLRCPGIDATNWRAEQAVRPMVVTRKVWGGNRTPEGARTQQRLVSLIQTCRQQRRSVLPLFAQLLCSPSPLTLSLQAFRNE